MNIVQNDKGNSVKGVEFAKMASIWTICTIPTSKHAYSKSHNNNHINNNIHRRHKHRRDFYNNWKHSESYHFHSKRIDSIYM